MKQHYLFSTAALLLATATYSSANADNHPMTPSIKVNDQFQPYLSFQKQLPANSTEANKAFKEQQMLEQTIRKSNLARQTAAGQFTHALTREYSGYNNTEIHYEYDELGQETLSTTYQKEFGTLYMTDRRTITYHDNGSPATFLEEHFSDGKTITSSESHFNEDMMRTYYEYKSSYYSGILETVQKSIQEYDSFGNTTLEEGYEYDIPVSEGGVGLYLATRYVNQTDGNGHVTNVESLAYSPNGSVIWGYKSDLTYENGLLSYIEAQNLSYEGADWRKSDCTYYYYDDQNRIIQEIIDIFDNNDILHYSKIEYTYNETGYVSNHYSFMDNDWELSSYTVQDGCEQTIYDQYAGEWYISSYQKEAEDETITRYYSLNYFSSELLPARLTMEYHTICDNHGNPTYHHIYQSWSPDECFEVTDISEYNEYGDIASGQEDWKNENAYTAEKTFTERNYLYDTELDGHKVMGCIYSHPMEYAYSHIDVYTRDSQEGEYTFDYEWAADAVYVYTELTPVAISQINTQQDSHQTYNIMGQPVESDASGLNIIHDSKGRSRMVLRK